MSSLERRIVNGIRDFIEKTVEREYAERGYNNVRPQVAVTFQKSISVTINTEIPYLGEEFWEFLSKVRAKIDNTVNVFGYVYKNTEYIYDFCVIHYEFNVE